MLAQWTRLSFYVALGLTALAILFPPFNIFGGIDEYGFILSGPPGFAEISQATAMLGNAMDGPGAHRFSGGMRFGIDFIRLAVEFAVIWGGYFALKRTVLKPAAA